MPNSALACDYEPPSDECTEVEVSAPVIDLQTQGDWDGVYGSCFFLLPNPDTPVFENPIGPDYFSEAPEQYKSENCYGGSLFDDHKVDWRIYRQTADGAAFAFSLAAGEYWEAFPEGEQWIPCRDAFRGATWDNDLSSADPLVVELKVDLIGSARIAYYFLDAANVCREEQLHLYVNGELKTETPVEIRDFASGKYVVFDLDCLTGDTVIKLEAKLLPQSSCVIEDPVLYYGVNSHISGVFIDCAPEAPMCFEVNSVKANTKGWFMCDSVEMKGSIKLPVNADPFNPKVDDITLNIWDDSFIIPAGSVKKYDWWGKTYYRYCGNIAGIGYVTLTLDFTKCEWELNITSGASTKAYIESEGTSVTMTVGDSVGTDDFNWTYKKSYCGICYAQFYEKNPTRCCESSKDCYFNCGTSYDICSYKH